MSEAFLCKHCMILENQIDDPDEFATCFYCGQVYLIEEGGIMNDGFGNSHNACRDCLVNYMMPCINCNEPYDKDALVDGLCPSCRNSDNEPRFNHIIIERPISASIIDRDTGDTLFEWQPTLVEF